MQTRCRPRKRQTAAPIGCEELVTSPLFSRVGEFNRELDRSDHAVRPRRAFSGELECGAVVRTGARKGQPESYIHAFVKRVQLKRNEPLIVIHAKDRIPFAVHSAMENRVW